MIGREFGNLTVKERARIGTRGESWNCDCKCGQIVRLTTSQLEDGYKSCGCAKKKSDKRQPVPTELRKKYSLTVRSWEAMLSRCHYVAQKQKCYEGIEICDSWFSFENFLKDVGPRPSKEYSIDRKNPELGYNKQNCRWLKKAANSSQIRRDLSPERNRRVSEGVRKAHAEGRIVYTNESRKKIAAGGAKRAGRKLQSCSKCGGKSYLPVCQKCGPI